MSDSTKRGGVHLLGGVGLALVAGAIITAVVLRDPAGLNALEGAPGARGPTEHGAAGEPPPDGSGSVDTPLKDSDLDAATTPAALERLSERYPEDPRVYRKLIPAYGNDEKTVDSALKALGHLLELDPASASEPAVDQLVEYAASLKPTSDAAFELMRAHMGSSGPDVLFEIATSATLPQPVRDHAWAILREDTAVAAKTSPSLHIAVELKKIEQPCARKPLLGQAERDGDKRSLPFLHAPPPQRCGFMGLSTCDCFGDHAELNRAVAAITAREKAPPH